MSGQIDRSGDDYSDKLVKLLPAEGIAVLTAVNRIIPEDSDNNFLIASAFLIVGVFVVLWAAQIRHISAKLQLLFITIAYVVWAANILWERLQPNWEFLARTGDFVPAVAALLFSLFIPLVFPRPAP